MQITGLVLHLRKGASKFRTKGDPTADYLKPVVTSRHNNAHSLGVAQLQPRPYFQRWKHENLV